jgi:hypothetical protein
MRAMLIEAMRRAVAHYVDEERERILKVINSWCACEPRKLWACRCDVYVKDLLEEIEATK